MIELQQHPLGVVLLVKAQPGGRANALRGVQDGHLKVSVTQVAEKGKANRAIVDVLVKSLKLRRSQVELLSGETSSQKKFLIRETSAAALMQAVEHAVGNV